MKKKELSPHLSLLSFSVIDAGLFIKVVGTIKNKLPVHIPVVRYQLEIRGRNGKVAGHQVEEITKLKPLETRKFESVIRREDVLDAKIIRMAAFQS